MNVFLKSHLDFLINLTRGGVDFIVVGGYATIYHGYVRTTGDLDIWLKPDNETKDKLVPVLQKLGISEESLDKVSSLDFLETIAFHFGNPPHRIDFLTRLSGLQYSLAREKAVVFTLKDISFPILDLDDLIVNKMMSNRPKDLMDLEGLKTIKRLKSNR